MRRVLLFTAVAVSAHSSAMFYDDFTGENGGFSALNYNGLANWDVSVGTIDLIASGDFGLVGDGMFLDMDGTSGIAGRIKTKNALNFTSGTEYRLSFRLAGSQRGGTDSMQVNVGSMFSETFNRISSDPWEVVVREFTAGSDVSEKLDFYHFGGDNFGMLLDNVRVEVVPEPASMAVLGIGALILVRRRKTTR